MRTDRSIVAEKLGPNVNVESRIHCNALSAASYAGCEEVVRLLLEKKANVNAQSELELWSASKNDQVAVMRCLLKKNKGDANLVFWNEGEVLQKISADFSR